MRNWRILRSAGLSTSAQFCKVSHTKKHRTDQSSQGTVTHTAKPASEGWEGHRPTPHQTPQRAQGPCTVFPLQSFKIIPSAMSSCPQIALASVAWYCPDIHSLKTSWYRSRLARQASSTLVVAAVETVAQSQMCSAIAQCSFSKDNPDAGCMERRNPRKKSCT